MTIFVYERLPLSLVITPCPRMTTLVQKTQPNFEGMTTLVQKTRPNFEGMTTLVQKTRPNFEGMTTLVQKTQFNYYHMWQKSGGYQNLLILLYIQ